MPDRHTFRLLWLAFAVAFVVLAWQFQDNLEMMFSRRGTLTVEEQSKQVILSWRGDVRAPLAARLEEAYREHARKTRHFVIALHSPGGSLEEGRDAIRLIRRMQQTHFVDTVIRDRHACASMCVAVYLAGTQRTAAPRARFMFHEVSFRDSLSEDVKRVPKEAIAHATDEFFERYLKPAGVDVRWLAQMREAIRGKDVWRTAEELVAQRAGVVQRLE